MAGVTVTLVLVATFILSAWLAAGLFYQDLPNLMPTHWSVPGKPNGFTAKPWGPFVLPLTMTIVWVARPVIRRLSLPRHRIERFPGAFDFKLMLTIGLLFVIWNAVVVQSVFWLRAAAIPVAVALIVAGAFAATLPFSAVSGLGTARFLTHDAEWLRARQLGSVLSVVAGVGILAIVAFVS